MSKKPNEEFRPQTVHWYLGQGSDFNICCPILGMLDNYCTDKAQHRLHHGRRHGFCGPKYLRAQGLSDHLYWINWFLTECSFLRHTPAHRYAHPTGLAS